jgi:hypothetical protein
MLSILPFTTVPCPKCKANIGQPCRSASGLEIAVGHPHVDRARAFGRKFPKPFTAKLRAWDKTRLVDKLPV